MSIFIELDSKNRLIGSFEIQNIDFYGNLIELDSKSRLIGSLEIHFFDPIKMCGQSNKNVVNL